jgi:soluble lytic murein transglycosylase-like protein
VVQAAEKHHVDPKLVRAVIATESSWNSSAVSSKGALGLMQLIPTTARQMGVGNAFDPAQNVDGGTHYLGMMLQRYNGDVGKALAAYNAGPGAVDRFGGVPNFPETRAYVRRVTSTYFGNGSIRETQPPPAPSIYRMTDTSGRLVFTNE